jgi:hypothetical protein
MPKRILLSDFVEVDSVDLSVFAHSMEFQSEHERVDVSGFNPTGANEYLAGTTTQSVTVEFFGSYGTGEVHQTLYPIHAGRDIVVFNWRPDQNKPVAVDNPQLTGNVQVLKYNPKGKRGDADSYEVEFTAADAAGLTFITTPPGP